MQFISDLRVLPEGGAVLLYGSGMRGQGFLAALQRHRPDVRVLGFVDSFREDLRAAPPIFMVGSLPGVLDEHPGAMVVITSHFYHEIYLRLRGVGVEAVSVSDPFFSNKPQTHGLSVSQREEFRQQMETVAPLFRREQDRQFATNLWRLFDPGSDATGDAGFFLDHHLQLREQYFDFITPELVEVAVDGGVMDGLTLLRFAHHLPQARVYGFEPYAPAFLLSPYRAHVGRRPNIEVVFQGLSDLCGTVHVQPSAYSLGGTRLVSGQAGDSGGAVQTTTLDAFVSERGLDRLDFVKLDIEGSELACLRGAADALQRFRPQLAVCLYHSPSDYHDIPAYLGSTLEDYHFYLGMYDLTTFEETVLYAIPVEKDRNP